MNWTDPSDDPLVLMFMSALWMVGLALVLAGVWVAWLGPLRWGQRQRFGALSPEKSRLMIDLIIAAIGFVLIGIGVAWPPMLKLYRTASGAPPNGRVDRKAVKVPSEPSSQTGAPALTREVSPISLASGHLDATEKASSTQPAIVAPILIHRVEPKLPTKALDSHVILEADITEKGDVVNIHVLEAPDLKVVQAYIEAVKQWKYKPATVRGEPARVKLTISVMH
jgi:Gram-negative bacterial TonB protein C-terminal